MYPATPVDRVTGGGVLYARQGRLLEKPLADKTKVKGFVHHHKHFPYFKQCDPWCVAVHGSHTMFVPCISYALTPLTPPTPPPPPPTRSPLVLLPVLGAQRGVEQNQVSLDEQVFASQALLYKCRRRRAQVTSDDVGCLLRLALAFTRRGLRPVLTQVGGLFFWGGGARGGNL